ncbi:MAG: hypothetical protein K0R71_1212 [Bacillales bacterium]|jgi:predicted alpha/beta-fold hydrolase|nr:hypothetical protein [Bacillales bacterium]
MIILNSNLQFRSAVDYLDEIHRKYPNAEIILTGHSLGGMLAKYASIKSRLNEVKDTITYCAPNIYFLLNPSDWTLLDKSYRNKITNIVHKNDWIGTYLIDNDASLNDSVTYYATNNTSDHRIASFNTFDSFGDVRYDDVIYTENN